MTLNELIEQLEFIREGLGSGEGTVRVASQPRYPLANHIANVVPAAGLVDLDVQREEALDSVDVWIAISEVTDHNESIYAPREAWDVF